MSLTLLSWKSFEYVAKEVYKRFIKDKDTPTNGVRSMLKSQTQTKGEKKLSKSKKDCKEVYIDQKNNISILPTSFSR